MRVVIADIHGCYGELMAILDLIGPSDEDEIIGDGDIIDGGPDSVRVVRFFMTRPNCFLVMGNHEYVHLGVYEKRMSRSKLGKNRIRTIKQFRRMSPSKSLSEYHAALAYFKRSPLFLDLPEAIIVHAGLEYGKSLDRQKEKILVGFDAPYLTKPSEPNGLPRWCDSYPESAKPVIFGHRPIGEPPWPLPQRGNLWPIDTGCANGGYLTAVTLPDFKVYRVRSFQA